MGASKLEWIAPNLEWIAPKWKLPIWSKTLQFESSQLGSASLQNESSQVGVNRSHIPPQQLPIWSNSLQSPSRGTPKYLLIGSTLGGFLPSSSHYPPISLPLYSQIPPTWALPGSLPTRVTHLYLWKPSLGVPTLALTCQWFTPNWELPGSSHF